MSREPSRMAQRALALAGLMQAVKLVQGIANDGKAPAAEFEATLASVFRLDADSVEAVYGSAALMQGGLRSLIGHLEGGSGRDPASSRIAVTVLHVERRLAGRSDLMGLIGDGVEAIARQRELMGITHLTVLTRLGDLYAETVSTLSPRVLVQGNPMQLSQPTVVAQIRATLLAAMRSAVLWRQLGGSYWDLILRRRGIVQAAKEWLPDGD